MAQSNSGLMTTSGRISAEHRKDDAKGSASVIRRLGELLTSRYIRSVGAQALVSGFHFGLNLLLVRSLSTYNYGIFAYAFVLALFASAINNALISTPLTVYTPVIQNQKDRREQEAMFSTLNVMLFLLLVFAGVAYAFSTDIASHITLSVTLFVAVYSARQYSRSFGYARLRPLVTATGDLTYVLAGIVIVAAIFWFGTELVQVSQILLALAAANLFAMFVERWRLRGGRRWFAFSQLGAYKKVWLQSRWALVGALTTLFLGQAHGLVITASNGPDAFAPLAAGMVLFGPVRVALLTWQNMVKPELAVSLSEQRQLDVRRQIRKTSILMGSAVILLGVALWIAWPHIHELLYSRQYADQPMGQIVCLWAVITFCAASYNAPSAALQAMRDFKVLAMASVYGALISGVLVVVTLTLWQPETTLFGILAAELFMAVYLTRVMLGRLQAPA